MFSMLGTALVLGIGGLDPTPALIAVGVLLAGADRRALSALALTVMIGSPLLGSILALTVGAELADVDWWVVVPRGQVGAVIELVVGIALSAFGVERLVRPGRRAPGSRRHRAGLGAAVTGAAVYVGSLVIDPTFVAVTVLAGRADRAATSVLMEVCWVLISQLPLLILLIAVHRVGRERAVAEFQRVWSRVRTALGRLATGALLAVGLFLVVDAGWWFGTAHFLLTGDRVL